MPQQKYTVREMNALYEVWKEDMQELGFDLDELRSDTLELLEEVNFNVSTIQLRTHIDYIVTVCKTYTPMLFQDNADLETKLKHHLTINALEYIQINMLESI